jgi:hypothetical protein
LFEKGSSKDSALQQANSLSNKAVHILPFVDLDEKVSKVVSENYQISSGAYQINDRSHRIFQPQEKQTEF